MTLPTPYFDDGQITIFCGDCRDVLPTLAAGRVDLVLTDPPYGVGAVFGPQYNDDPAIYWEWFHPTLQEMRRVGRVVAVHHDSRALREITDWEWLLCWNKGAAGKLRIGNSPIVPQWEPIFVWGIYTLGVHNEPLFDVITVPIEASNPFGRGRVGWQALACHPQAKHPTPKPVALERHLVQRLAPTDGLILDPFMGSGTTLRAAKDLGRRAIGIEIEERYCQIAVDRLQQAALPWDAPQDTAEPLQQSVLL
jgi:site-specific DNA-methyltransferase (adenine-specific)